MRIQIHDLIEQIKSLAPY